MVTIFLPVREENQNEDNPRERSRRYKLVMHKPRVCYFEAYPFKNDLNYICALNYLRIKLALKRFQNIRYQIQPQRFTISR